MDLKRFTRVIARGTKTRYGTGYFLDSERVLTARHVIADAKSIAVQYDDLYGRRIETAAASTWPGEGDLDVAVLGVKTDLRIARQILRRTPLTRDQQWRSRGWARAGLPPAKDDSSILATLTALWGIAAEFVDTTRYLELGVESAPKTAEWWRGVSGAPIFCGWELVGTIEGGSEAFAGGRLRAVPVSAMWNAPGFLEAVGYDASLDELRQERRRQLVQDVSELLREHSEAALAIASEKAEWKELSTYGKPHQGGFRALAEAICSQPWREVLEAFFSAHEKQLQRARSDAERAAHAIVRILERVLPEVYGATSLEVMPSANGGQMITLPIETETLTELALAAFDGRSLAYEEVAAQQHYPQGTALFRLPNEKLERGLDMQGDQAWREWLALVAKGVKLPPSDVKALTDPGRLSDLAKRINHALDREVRFFREPRRYFAYPSRFAENSRAFLAKVREQLPALHLVELAGDTMVDERMECDPLQVILFRSYQARNRKT